jgi:hypothetical protein
MTFLRVYCCDSCLAVCLLLSSFLRIYSQWLGRNECVTVLGDVSDAQKPVSHDHYKQVTRLTSSFLSSSHTSGLTVGDSKADA